MKKLFFIFFLTHTVLAFSENSYPELCKLLFKIYTITEEEVAQEGKALGELLRSEIRRELAKQEGNYIIFSMAAAAFPENVDDYVTLARPLMPTYINAEIKSRLRNFSDKFDQIEATKDSFSKEEMHTIETYFRLKLAEETLEKFEGIQAAAPNNLGKRIFCQRKKPKV
jgi:hypothetical protein